MVLEVRARPLGRLTNGARAEVRIDVRPTRPAFVLVAFSRARAETMQPVAKEDSQANGSGDQNKTN